MSLLFLNIYTDTYNLTKNFTNSEVINASHPEEGQDIVFLDENVIQVAQYLRSVLGVPLGINSAYRNSQYNSTILGSSKKSQHVNGRALDLRGKGLLEFMLKAESEHNEHFKAMYELGLRGIGFYDWGVHIDTRETESVAVWDYRKKKVLIKAGLVFVIVMVLGWISGRQ